MIQGRTTRRYLSIDIDNWRVAKIDSAEGDDYHRINISEDDTEYRFLTWTRTLVEAEVLAEAWVDRGEKRKA